MLPRLGSHTDCRSGYRVRTLVQTRPNEKSLHVLRRNTLLIALVACTWLQAYPEARQAVDTTTGAISGRVTDASGAVLPGVTITLSSEAVIGNRGTRATQTGGDGLYRFPALSPGDYSLFFWLEGFSTVSREGIHVGVAFTATVNIVLEVGAVSQSVTVERKSPVIDTQSTAIATGFDARQLANLPGSRSTFAILTATPAVQVGHFEVGGSSGDSGIPYSAYGTEQRESADGRGDRRHWNLSFRLHARLRVVQRSIGGHGRPRRRVAHAGRPDAIHRQVGRESVPRHFLRRATSTTIGNRSTSTRIKSDRRHKAAPRYHRGKPIVCGAITISTAISADTSSRTRSGGIRRFASRTSRPGRSTFR